MNYLGSKVMETERLELRPQTMEEQKYLWEVLMMPEVNKFYLTVPKKFREKLMDWSKQEEYYKADIEHANDTDVFRWSVFLKDTGECIGRISCHEASHEDETISNPFIRGVGWYIDPKHQGKGYGLEAAKAMIEFMFTECDIEAIQTGAAVVNPASWKIMERLGFVRANKTRLIEYTYLDEPIEEYLYSITKEQWLALQNNTNNLKR